VDRPTICQSIRIGRSYSQDSKPKVSQEAKVIPVSKKYSLHPKLFECFDWNTNIKESVDSQPPQQPNSKPTRFSSKHILKTYYLIFPTPSFIYLAFQFSSTQCTWMKGLDHIQCSYTFIQNLFMSTSHQMAVVLYSWPLSWDKITECLMNRHFIHARQKDQSSSLSLSSLFKESVRNLQKYPIRILFGFEPTFQ
jgi:predicted HNH restriction endonuclease